MDRDKQTPDTALYVSKSLALLQLYQHTAVPAGTYSSTCLYSVLDLHVVEVPGYICRGDTSQYSNRILAQIYYQYSCTRYRSNIKIHIHVHVHTLIHMLYIYYTCTYTQTKKYTCTYAYTYTYTNTYPPPCPCGTDGVLECPILPPGVLDFVN